MQSWISSVLVACYHRNRSIFSSVVIPVSKQVTVRHMRESSKKVGIARADGEENHRTSGHREQMSSADYADIVASEPMRLSAASART